MQVPFHVMFPTPIKAFSPRTCGCGQCCLPWQGGKGSSLGSLMQRIWAFRQMKDCSPCAPGSLFSYGFQVFLKNYLISCDILAENHLVSANPDS